MIKVLVILGTRPEVIKLAPVIHTLKSSEQGFEVVVCSTGQHNEMLYQVLEYFDIKPDIDLKLMKSGQSLSELTAALLSRLPAVYEEIDPDITMVQGDTTTAMAGGLISYYHRKAVCHVEAGLRTGDKYAPFPEELNRRLLSTLTDYHFAPTEKAAETLSREGIDKSRILITGNTVIDALLYTVEKNKISKPSLGKLDAIVADNEKIVLITGHRRENFGRGFQNICGAIHELAQSYEQVQFIYPVHLNPNVQKPVYTMLGNLPNIHLVNPIGYIPFVRLMSAAHLILTDSGGIQEEAPSLGKPVLVMREKTERQEAIEAGTAKLVGTDQSKIVSEARRLLDDHKTWETMSKIKNAFGDGKAAERIHDFLLTI
jgi:UDP-N-acetylglucosamine 2-epimerase (non-hydrolysing)